MEETMKNAARRLFIVNSRSEEATKFLVFVLRKITIAIVKIDIFEMQILQT